MFEYYNNTDSFMFDIMKITEYKKFVIGKIFKQRDEYFYD